MKKVLAVVLVVAGMAFAPMAFADNHGGKECSKGDSSCSMKDGAKMCGKCGQMQESNQCPIIDKIMKKAHFFLDNQNEIGLSADQVKEIKTIKTDVAKSSIKMGASMQIFMLDLESKLGEDTVDIEGLGSMVDQGMAGMSQETKANIALYAKLKSVLTAEQMAKAKEIWKKK